MNYNNIFTRLQQNAIVFQGLLQNIPPEEYLWKPAPEKWCMLEIICHLYDEEREDFRTRVKSVLENPVTPLPPINPVAWVEERNYLQQNFSEKLDTFLAERKNSVNWLFSLVNPQWGNAYLHPKYGAWSAHHFLSNWLAHDYLHIRQIARLKYDYLKEISGEGLEYAGNWV